MFLLSRHSSYPAYLILILISVIYFSCETETHKKVPLIIQYEEFKDSVLSHDTGSILINENIFDKPEFTPGIDSLDTLLVTIDSLWRQELHLMEHLDTLKKGIKKEPGFSVEELAAIKENINVVDSFLKARDSVITGSCKGMDCLLYVEIEKSTQTMFLYLLSELKDSFKVSTGKGKYETPDMELHPGGPVLTKYTSRKFPGGNYKGFGNMPYAVFLKNGYAIHGTTPGNFALLGTKASHGCIRLHPDNAKILNALIKTVGLSQTWVTITDSLQ